MAYRHGSVDEQVIKDTIEDDIFFKGTPEYVIGNKDVVIDVGAHIGAFSALAASRIPNGIIYALEPSQETFEILAKNIKINGFKNVIPVRKALYSRKGEIKLFHDIENGNWGHSIVKEFSTEGEIIHCDTLENFFIEHEIKLCNFIKFNCEGAEFEILLSAPIDILKRIETVLILYHGDLEQRHSLQDLLAHLKKARFITVTRFQFGDRGWIIGHRSWVRHLLIILKSFAKILIGSVEQWSKKSQK